MTIAMETANDMFLPSGAAPAGGGAPDAAYDAVVRAAACLMACPMSAIMLLDARGQDFAASLGLAPDQRRSRTSFNDHVVTRETPLVVPDARVDPRFRGRPLVAGPPHIRFFLGAPIRLASGVVIGVLGVADARPRAHVDPDDLAAMADLAAITAELASNRAEQRMLERMSEHLAMEVRPG